MKTIAVALAAVISTMSANFGSIVALATEIGSSSSTANTDSPPCRGDCSITNGVKVCRFDSKVNLFASELGYFEFSQCGNTPYPTLGLEKGVTYIFSQTHETNYFHPLGFAYYPDGAHNDVDELEPLISPPGSNSTCTSTVSCPAPMYFKDGMYRGTYSNNEYFSSLNGSENFGLDEYEPEFFFNALTWNSAEYSVALKFDVDDFTDDIFYFCHIHEFMTGRIKFVDENNVPLNHKGDTPEIPYNYYDDAPSEYDKSCGTFNLANFRLPQQECPSMFVCDKPSIDTPVGKFADCLESMNCAMTMGMTSYVNNNSAIALFIHQMIPHHQNAVNMCKALMKSGDIECSGIGSDEDDHRCIMRRLCFGIINNQNHEIQIMRGVLESSNYDAEDDCKVHVNSGSWKSGLSFSIMCVTFICTALYMMYN